MIGKICGTGSYVPNRCISNQELSERVDTSDEWIRERTGIANRYISETVNVTEMAIEASLKAVENSGIDAEDIDLIIVATSSAENIYPCTACMVQEAIGAKHAGAFDINAACTGFVTAFNTAQSFIATGLYEVILVIGAERMSNLLDWNDRNTCILFGDGAGAVVLTKDANSSKCYMAAHADGKKGNAILLKTGQCGIQMDGQAVFKFAVRKIPEIVEELLMQSHLNTEDIDYFILHQANRRIIEAAAKRLNISMERFPMNMEKYANTSAASIPILLDEMNNEGRFQKGQRLLMAGFGAGLTWAGCIIEW